MSRPTRNAHPVISFGLPVRNGAPTIGQAIESVLAQTFEDWGARHLRQPVIRRHLGDLRLVRRARRAHWPCSRRAATSGSTANFHAAFHHSRGTFFRWHGDDDWLEPTYAERTVAALAGSAGAVLCTTRQQYYRDGDPLPVNDPVLRLGGVGSADPSTGSAPAPSPAERRPSRDRPRLLAGPAGRSGEDGPSTAHS